MVCRSGAPGLFIPLIGTESQWFRERIRWAPVEAIGTAYALYTVTGDKKYEEFYQTWWDYCHYTHT
ncbi:AGE family epimerase/isomerase [Vibrio lentus]|nr:AGE family epimerase/isomerase [Vibrio lentus]